LRESTELWLAMLNKYLNPKLSL